MIFIDYSYICIIFGTILSRLIDPIYSFITQSEWKKNTCSILFVAELRTRDLVTWPSRPSPPSHRAACQLACNHNKHVAWPPSPTTTAGEARRGKTWYWITDIGAYNEIAIKRLIVACWHIPRIGERGGKPENQ